MRYTSGSARWRLAIAGLGVVVVAGSGPGDAMAQPQDHQYTSQDIQMGSRVYSRECALCHGSNGDEVDGVDLQRGPFRRVVSDDDIRRLVSEGLPDEGMPAVALRSDELDGLVAFIRAGFDPDAVAVRVGDAARGRDLFEGKGRCATCHRVRGRGPLTAPDLSDIGAVRSPATLQRSLLDPTATMRPINRPLRAVTRRGETIVGRRLNEDTFTVQVIDAEGRLRSLTKSDLVEMELARRSPMPSMAERLTADEIADLVGYLLSLRGMP